MEVEIFTHRNCTECNLLVEYLEEKGLLGKVKLVDTETQPFLALERGLSQPPQFSWMVNSCMPEKWTLRSLRRYLRVKAYPGPTIGRNSSLG